MIRKTRTFVPLPRIAALSAAITLFAASLASAQSPIAAPSVMAPANTALLSSAAFARLIQPPPADVAPAPVVEGPARPTLLRQATAAMARQAQKTSAPAAKERRWAARHKTITAIIIGASVFFGAVLLALTYGDD
jgi:hypothetical protein